MSVSYSACSGSFHTEKMESHMHGFLTHFILACFWGRSRPCGESLWCFSVITFSSTQVSQFTTQDTQKIEVSFFFKREAVRIASNASLVWLILLPHPPTHCHLHLIGWEGPGTILKVFHHVASLFNRAFNKRVWCICPLTTVSFFLSPMMGSNLGCDQTHRLFPLQFCVHASSHAPVQQRCTNIWSQCICSLSRFPPSATEHLYLQTWMVLKQLFKVNCTSLSSFNTTCLFFREKSLLLH